MAVVLVLLIIVSFVLMVVGVFKPTMVVRWGNKRNRKWAVGIYGGLFVASFIMLGFIANAEPQANGNNVKATKSIESAAKVAAPSKAEASESKDTSINYTADEARNKINDWLWEHEFPNSPKLSLEPGIEEGRIFEYAGGRYHMFTLIGLKKQVDILVDVSTGALYFYNSGLDNPQPLDKWYVGYLTANKSKGNVEQINENFAWVQKPGIEDGAVVGIVKNISNKTFKNVYIQFNCYDSSGNKIGTLDQQISNLKPGDTWKFGILLYVPNVATYDLASIEGYTW